MQSLFITLSLFVLAVLSATPKFQFYGVNEAGLEFGEGKYPGTVWQDYVYPAKSSIDYFKSYGFNSIRLPFSWERIQPTLNGTFDKEYSQYVYDAVNYTTNTRKLSLFLDLHNYCRYNGNIIGSAEVPYSAFYNLWYKLALAFKYNTRVRFGISNEPNEMPDENVVNSMNIAIKAIRAAGAGQAIMVSGNRWSGAHSWQESGNYKIMKNIKDPKNNFMFDIHQYFDRDSSGRYACNLNFDNEKAFGYVTKWLRDNKKKAVLGEFSIEDTPECLAVLDKSMAYLRKNSDVWIGFQYWAAGPWWGNNNKMIEPRSDGSVRPQLPVLKKYFV